ncbi:MAG: DUF2937 family protein [Devosia sp.]
MRRVLGMLGGLFVGFAFAQFPEYAQQYQQRLGGAVDELRIIVEDFDRGANAFGLNREEALARFAENGDGFIVDRGLAMQRTIQRYEKLNADLSLIQTASPIERVGLLPRYLDSDVAQKALANFNAGVPFTPEGLAWAAAGFLIGFSALLAIVNVLLLPFRWRRGELPGPARLPRRAGT